MSMSPLSFPFKQPLSEPNVNFLFSRGVSTFLGRITRYELGFAGRVRLHLRLSVGDVVVSGNRDTIPLTLEVGDWVRARVLRRYGTEESGVVLSALRILMTAPEDTTAWLPTSLCHREIHMRRLRTLLTQLEPHIQAAFIAAMSDAQVQRRFFWRVGAADHHCYPGGLFDQSVHAAELAFAQVHASAAEQGVATLAALLFDLGKTFDPVLSFDEVRTASPLASHRMTPLRLRRAYEVLGRMNPAAAESFRAVIAANPGSAVGGPPEVAALAERVRAAVRQSWSLK